MRVLVGECNIKIRRTRVLEDSYGAVVVRIGEDLKKMIDGEDGLVFQGTYFSPVSSLHAY